MELTRPDGTPLRVLVVDDEANIAELISMALVARLRGLMRRAGAQQATAWRSCGRSSPPTGVP